MYKLGINFDEISDNLDISLQLMKENNVSFGELRTIGKKNFVFWTDEEVEVFYKSIRKNNIELVAAATPLFKWYVNERDPEVVHDSFGFDPRISAADKQRIIARTISIASKLGIPRLRIFSGLGAATDAGAIFANDPLLAYALERADKANIDLCLENEPVCRVHDKKQLVELFKKNNHPRLKFWLDIANMTELNEVIDDVFIQEMAPRLSYLHIKDYVNSGGRKKYVPAGEGEIDYDTILGRIFKYCTDDLVLTVETHAQENKAEMSSRAIVGTRLLLSKQGVNL